MPLLPEMKLSKFQELCENELKELPSVDIVSEDGFYLGTFVNSQTDYIKLQAQYLGDQSNGVTEKTAERARQMLAAPWPNNKHRDYSPKEK
jgi:hypothetical protein